VCVIFRLHNWLKLHMSCILYIYELTFFLSGMVTIHTLGFRQFQMECVWWGCRNTMLYYSPTYDDNITVCVKKIKQSFYIRSKWSMIVFIKQTQLSIKKKTGHLICPTCCMLCIKYITPTTLPTGGFKLFAGHRRFW